MKKVTKMHFSTYYKCTVDDVKTTINSNRVTNGPEGTISTKTATSLELVEKGLEKLDMNFTEVNPDFKIKPEVYLTVQVENLHAVSHLKHPANTVLEYARDFGNTMHESLKHTTIGQHFTSHTPSHTIQFLKTKLLWRIFPK